MNGESKTNLGLNIGTLIALIIALVAGGAISADLYTIVVRLEKQSISNGDAVNQSIARIVQTQQDANDRGNLTILSFEQLFTKILNSESNIIGNLSDHRKISNISRDTQIDLLKQILNQTR